VEFRKMKEARDDAAAQNLILLERLRGRESRPSEHGPTGRSFPTVPDDPDA
jgi:hypothetical protein